jgi:hypothetical protein
MGHVVATAETVMFMAEHQEKVILTLPEKRLLDIPLVYCIFTEQDAVYQ